MIKKASRFGLLGFVALAVALPGCDDGDDGPSPNAVPIRVLTYNVGNPNGDDPTYPLRLKHQIFADHLGAKIQAMEADVVFLQEVLPTTHCDAIGETDPALTCFDWENRDPPVRRLLGPDYSIVCDQREHVECIGVRVGFGTIDGLDVGGYRLSGAETPALPMDSCIYANEECSNDFCDAESTVSAVTAVTDFGELRLVHAHPNASGITGPEGSYNGVPCRTLQLQQIFETLAGHDDTPLIADGPTIVGGDFNLAPSLWITDEESAVWDLWVGDGLRFTDFNPVDGESVQYATCRGCYGLALDHVLADRASGSCVVHGHDEMFGSDPGTLPLDEDFDWSLVPDEEWYGGRLDHFAVLCDLEMDFTD